MSADIAALIEPLQPFAHDLVNLGARAGVQPRVTSTLRSRSQQQRLYAAYLRGETKYPVAPPGTSAHEFGFAFDMVAVTAEDLHDLGTVWRSWGGVWSADDEVHFEYPGFVRPAMIEGTPSEGLKGAVDVAVQAYQSVPWYVSLFFPAYLTTSENTITPTSVRQRLCQLGWSSMCQK
jgi:D-alanyl-D-alanine carboxypeptidase